ncbi:MAG: SprT-like domain-containing protein, partial [Candidatus Methylomirabilia bacterium]
SCRCGPPSASLRSAVGAQRQDPAVRTGTEDELTPWRPPAILPRMIERDDIDIERAILLGLAAEWREALALLPRRLRDQVRRPQFSLSDAESRLGVWDAAREEIRVSRRFARERGWDEVRELLRHEMAHQVADQALAGGAETSHGPAFREACRLLGAHPGASGEFVPLGTRLDGDTTPGRARVIARVHKLLALASSGNRHEAELALLRAREYARRHRVDGHQGSEEFLSAFAGRPALRHSREEYQLAALVTRTWEAYGIWVPAWVVERERMGTVLELSGTPAQVKLAGYVHEFVRRHIATEWARYNHGRGLGARRRTDFGCGVIEGFRGTLERGGKSPGVGEAVVRTGQDPLFARYLAARYPRRTTIRRGGGSVDPGVHRDGVRAGERLVINKGVEGAPSPRRLLR